MVVKAVREAGIEDGFLPKICISGCPSSCSAHQAGAIGFQGGVKRVDNTPCPAFRMTLGGSDHLGKAQFGEGSVTILEQDMPALFVELGKAAQDCGLCWEDWSKSHSKERDAIIAKYS